MRWRTGLRSNDTFKSTADSVLVSKLSRAVGACIRPCYSVAASYLVVVVKLYWHLTVDGVSHVGMGSPRLDTAMQAFWTAQS